MARLDRKPYPGAWHQLEGESIDAYLARTRALLNVIPPDQLLDFPVADGRAFYFVKSMKPLVLQHVPYGDAYRIADAHVRGLTVKDVQRQLKAHAAIRALFKGGDGGC